MWTATLTNNSGRGTGTNPPIDPANPRPANVYGHIIKWYYRKDWTEPTFGWDIFALAGDPANPAHGSTIVGDKYGSPDGIYVAPSGRLWIQTDVSGSTINSGAYAGFGNNQMLCADVKTGETRRFLVGPNICEITGGCSSRPMSAPCSSAFSIQEKLPAARTSPPIRSATAPGPKERRADGRGQLAS